MRYSAAGVIQYLSMRLDFLGDIDHEVIRRTANYVVQGTWSMADAEEFLTQVREQNLRLGRSSNRTATALLQQQEAATERMRTSFNDMMGPGYWESCEDQRRARLAALDTFGIPPERVPKDGSNRVTAEVLQQEQESAAEQMTNLWKEIMEEDFRPSHTARMQEAMEWMNSRETVLEIPSSLRTAEQQARILAELQRQDEENRYRLELLKDSSFIDKFFRHDDRRWHRAGRSSPTGAVPPEPEILLATGKRKIVLE